MAGTQSFRSKRLPRTAGLPANQLTHSRGSHNSRQFDEPPANTRRKAAWARLIQTAYEVDPLECVNCGSNMRITALIDDVDMVERILKHLKVWDHQPDTITPAGPDPPLPQGETLSLTYHPVPAHLKSTSARPCGPVMVGSPGSGKSATQSARIRFIPRPADWFRGFVLAPTKDQSAPIALPDLYLVGGLGRHN